MDDQKKFPTHLAYLSFFILCFFLTIPPFLNGYWVANDILYQLNWNELFQQQLFAGDLYPRWLFELYGGRGSPSFYFGCPLPYYVSAFFALLIPGEQSSWYSLGACYWFALAVSATGLFRLLTCYTRPGAAYMVTLFYILYPYHLVVDLYIRFAFTEFFAIFIVPYLFLFSHQLATGNRSAAPKLSFAYCLLILSHIPTTLLISPFICIHYWVVSTASKKAFRICTALAYGVGLSAFYLVPVFFLKKHIAIPQLFFGRYYYENAFLLVGGKLFPDWANFWALLNNLAMISLALAILTIVVQSKPSRLAWFFFLTCILSIYMMYPVSSIVWQALPPLQIVQFPWRFFIVLNFFLFFNLALIYGKQLPKRNVVKTSMQKLLVAILIALSLFSLVSCYRYSATSVSTEEKTYIDKALATGNTGGSENLPRGVSATLVDDVNNNTLTRIDRLFEVTDVRLIQAPRLQNDKIYLEIMMPEPGVLKFNQFYFPTWQCIDKISGIEKKIVKTAKGFMEIELEAGAYHLVFKHRMTASEKFGIVLSLLTAAALIWRARRV
ncbi:hypothetical protein P9J64_04430 [Deltaproteobacteria bacterium IMCC39524]|nr:hypothetical protein [Deltaproteobacteria bacterium IMCC39524]